jgi:hypothetical protein
MNPRWLLIRRLRGPAYLLTFGVTALLNQWDILSFGQSWPLYLIVAGVLTLTERAALANAVSPYGDPTLGGQYGVPYGQPPYGAPAPSQVPQYQSSAYQNTPASSTAVVPVPPSGIERNDPTGRS